MTIREYLKAVEAALVSMAVDNLDRQLYSGGKPVISLDVLVAGPDGQGREIVVSTKATE